MSATHLCRRRCSEPRLVACVTTVHLRSHAATKLTAQQKVSEWIHSTWWCECFRPVVRPSDEHSASSESSAPSAAQLMHTIAPSRLAARQSAREHQHTLASSSVIRSLLIFNRTVLLQTSNTFSSRSDRCDGTSATGSATATALRATRKGAALLLPTAQDIASIDRICTESCQV